MVMFGPCFPRRVSSKSAPHPWPYAVLTLEGGAHEAQVVDGLAILSSEGVPGGVHQHAALLASLASQSRVFKAVLEAFRDEATLSGGQEQGLQQSMVIDMGGHCPDAWPPKLSCSLRIMTVPQPLHTVSFKNSTASSQGVRAPVGNQQHVALILEHVPAGGGFPAPSKNALLDSKGYGSQHRSCSSRESLCVKHPGSPSDNKSNHSLGGWWQSSREQGTLAGVLDQQQQQLLQHQEQQQQHHYHHHHQMEQQQLQPCLRSGLIVDEAPILATLFDRDGHVLEQNRGSREFYGALGKEGMWSKAAGPQAASEKLCPAHAEGSLQGILLELFAADDTKMLAGLLQHIDDGMAWRGTIRVKPRLAAAAAATGPEEATGSAAPTGIEEKGAAALVAHTRTKEKEKTALAAHTGTGEKPCGDELLDSNQAANSVGNYNPLSFGAHNTSTHATEIHDSAEGSRELRRGAGSTSLDLPRTFQGRSDPQAPSLLSRASFDINPQRKLRNVPKASPSFSSRLQSQLCKRAEHPHQPKVLFGRSSLEASRRSSSKTQQQCVVSPRMDAFSLQPQHANAGRPWPFSAGKMEAAWHGLARQQEAAAEGRLQGGADEDQQQGGGPEKPKLVESDEKQRLVGFQEEQSKEGKGKGFIAVPTYEINLAEAKMEQSKCELQVPRLRQAWKQHRHVMGLQEGIPTCLQLDPASAVVDCSGTSKSTQREGTGTHARDGRSLFKQCTQKEEFGRILSLQSVQEEGEQPLASWQGFTREGGGVSQIQKAAALQGFLQSISCRSLAARTTYSGGAVSKELKQGCARSMSMECLEGGGLRASLHQQDSATSISRSITLAEPACFHDLELKPARDPMTGQPVFILLQRDVSERVEQEQLLSGLTEAQLLMLSQIFPRHVIDALSSDDAITVANISDMAYSHADVTILFLDLVGFTSMSSKSKSPEEVLIFLNLIFGRFDKLVDKYQVQKIDTIGDCFFLASGILAPDEDGFWAVDKAHDPIAGAGRMIGLAIEMQRATYDVFMPDGQPVQVRIGIHTGPCVSGLVGLTVPKWSVFGDSVNVAARAEQTAMPQTIQISSATVGLLPQDVGLELTPTGGVAMKGKGVMETWVWKHPPHWKECTSGLPPLPHSCTLLHERFCAPSWSHCSSSQLPASMLLPKVIQASLKRSETINAHEGLLVSLDEAGEQRSPCLAKRRKSFRTCDSSSHTLHSPKCSPPPTLLAPALSPDGGCMPAAAPTKHPRTSSAGVFPLASPSGPPSFLSAQQDRGSLHASLLEAELRSWAISHQVPLAPLKENKVDQGQEKEED
uniref:Guanylate cyclase domain-containing protein n=2 Tax=Dunaliella tertiolecta TaxID=3047 RepID=A0A7S3VK08_DUNTE|mmetsp:Transcript_30326/g.78813  ORF Transcript_30326/g.78813 Transcript_30326/m.78813 type:complete len:1304 (+) Transcript_30326:838-4749(+)